MADDRQRNCPMIGPRSTAEMTAQTETITVKAEVPTRPLLEVVFS